MIFATGSDCPKELRELAGGYFDRQGILKPTAYGRFASFMKRAGAFKHDVRCYEDAISFIAQVRDQAELGRRIDKAFVRGIGSAAFKKLLKFPLYAYQRRGALFMARAGRCLLADDSQGQGIEGRQCSRVL